MFVASSFFYDLISFDLVLLGKNKILLIEWSVVILIHSAQEKRFDCCELKENSLFS